MAMPYQPWRAALQPASYGAAGFHVEVGSQSGGRRIALHEYPKRDTPYAEDMGRKARRWPITGYCIGPFYLVDRDALIAVLEAGGAATLVHPTLGWNQAVCEGYSVTETREKGGFCVFEMQFAEAGANPDNSVTDDTQAQAAAAASSSNASAAAALDAGLAGQGGIGSADVTPLTTPAPTAVGGVGGIPSAYPVTGGIGSA